MIAWVNFAVLIFSTLFFLYFYFLSVGPAALEKVRGEAAYRLCRLLQAQRFAFASGVPNVRPKA